MIRPAKSWQWLTEGISLILVAAPLLLLLTQWTTLPSRVPIHFAIDGSADRWAPKTSFWILPASAFLVWLVLGLTARFPVLLNLPCSVDRSSSAFLGVLYDFLSLFKPLVLSLIALITYQGLETALSNREGLSPWLVPVYLIAVAAVLTSFYSRLRRLS